MFRFLQHCLTEEARFQVGVGPSIASEIVIVKGWLRSSLRAYNGIDVLTDSVVIGDRSNTCL